MYSEVTNIIIEALENGVRPWSEPMWKGADAPRLSMPLRHNGEAYKGINIVILWSMATKKNYVSPHWMTYKQAKELGGQVKKGEKSTPVFYAGKLKIEDDAAASAEEEEKFIHYMKSYRVFNVEQIEDLPEKYYYRPAPWPENPDLERMAEVENFITKTGANICFGGDSAYYDPNSDSVSMPVLEDFKSASAYYAVLLHEITHWTGHKSRLDRGFAADGKYSEDYAFEELIAELGAAFLCADNGVMSDIRGDHARYIDGWLKILKEDKKAIFRAASKAQKAAEYLHGLQPDHKGDDPDTGAKMKADSAPVCEQNAYNNMQSGPATLADRRTAIKQKYGQDYHRNPEAMREIAALWGIKASTDQINAHGVILDHCEAFTAKAGSCKAEAKFAQTPNGQWLYNTSYTTPTGGGGGPLSIWNKDFESYDAARLDAIAYLKNRFESNITTMNSCVSESERRYSRQMITELDAAKTPQLSLF